MEYIMAFLLLLGVGILLIFAPLLILVYAGLAVLQSFAWLLLQLYPVVQLVISKWI